MADLIDCTVYVYPGSGSLAWGCYTCGITDANGYTTVDEADDAARAHASSKAAERVDIAAQQAEADREPASLPEWACQRPGCAHPRHLNHYHCGNCRSPEILGMMGHYTRFESGEWGFTCAT